MLSQEHTDKLRELLIAACDKFLAKGGRVIAGAFRNSEDRYCPVTCLVGPISHRNPEASYEKAISQVLGIEFSEQDLWKFVDAFDGTQLMDDQIPLVKLGHELRAKYILPNKKD